MSFFAESDGEESIVKKRGKIIVIAILVLVVIAGIAAVSIAVWKKRTAGVPVTVEKVEKGKIISIVTANGKVEARTKVNISADVMGKILKIPVVEGQRVEQGQLLVEIDRAQVEAQVAQMRAALTSAKFDRQQAAIEFEREERLLKLNLVSQAEYDLARTTLDRATAAVRQCEANLDQSLNQLGKYTILSPMAGTITQLNSKVGENVIVGTMNNPGTVIMVISGLAEIVVKAEVDETDIASVALGQKVEIALDAFPDKKFQGTVTEIGNAAKTSGVGQQEVTNFEVTVLITDKIPGIKPGMNATVDVTTNTRESTLKVPIQAVVMRNPAEKSNDKKSPAQDIREPGEDAEARTAARKSPKDEEEVDGVFLVEAGTAKFVPVKTGISDQQTIEILDGLKEGQTIVTGSYKTLRSLKSGQKIKPQEREGPKGGKEQKNATA
jgi:HlyD family secretion protein